MRILTTALFLILVLTVSAAGQNKTAEIPEKFLETQPAEQAKEVLRELAQSQYRAKMDIPALDSIFVEGGKIAQGMYRSALKDNPKALPAGAVTKVSSVRVMDHGIQVFFAGDSCALIAVSPGSLDTAAMSVKESVKMAKKSIAPLFETVPPEKAGKEEKGETREEPKKKN